MENDKELTREVFEEMTWCTSTSCFNCKAHDALCRGNTVSHTISTIARALLAEMDKPKVWDGAPDNAGFASVNFCKESGVPLQFGKTMFYTRELPKFRAREIAEEAWGDCHSDITTKEADIARIESAILKALAEKEAGK